jgi:tRNA (guanine-N7-)-methyltransferase
MSNKNKLDRFEQLHNFANVYENESDLAPKLNHLKADAGDMRGRWAAHFGNDNPIVLELACGKGDYTRALAADYPNRNYIGVDIKGNRMWVGAKAALDEGCKNVAFLRTRIESISSFFAEGEVTEIWITFADPQLTKPRKRLTSPQFLARYRHFLAKSHLINLKTDSPELYQFTLETIAEEKLTLHYQKDDIYAAPLDFQALRHKTFYEQMHLRNGKSIKFVQFSLPDIYPPITQ